MGLMVKSLSNPIVDNRLYVEKNKLGPSLREFFSP
jgi:hypothetical protein